MTTTIDEGLIAYLRSKTGITNLVSTRVFGMMIPQSATLPCITTQRISTPRISTMDSSGATGDLTSPRFQIDAWATTQKSAKAIADAIRAELNGHTGTTGTGVTVHAILAEGESPSYDPDTSLYRVRSDYLVWQQEA